MTLLDELEAHPAAEPQSARPPALPIGKTLRDLARHPVANWTVAVVLVVVAFMLAFETVGTQLWYNAHQSALTQKFLTDGGPISRGTSAAVLQIPALGLRLTVIEGDGASELRSGPGHRRHTPLPGKKGNSIITGHRSRWGAPFHDLDKLKKGAVIVVQSRKDLPVYYRVVETHAISGSNTKYFAQTSDTRLTLVTGRGGSLSSDRFVVIAVAGTPDPKAARAGATSKVSANGPDGGIPAPFAGLAALLLLGAAAIAFVPLRTRYRVATVVVICTPFVFAGLLALFIQLDAFMPSLR